MQDQDIYKNDDEVFETYSYQGIQVKLITAFRNGDKSIAIVEDENGEQFEVFKSELY